MVKQETAWHLSSCEYDVIGKFSMSGQQHCILFNQLHTHVCMMVAPPPLVHAVIVVGYLVSCCSELSLVPGNKATLSPTVFSHINVKFDYLCSLYTAYITALCMSNSINCPTMLGIPYNQIPFQKVEDYLGDTEMGMVNGPDGTTRSGCVS